MNFLNKKINNYFSQPVIPYNSFDELKSEPQDSLMTNKHLSRRSVISSITAAAIFPFSSLTHAADNPSWVYLNDFIVDIEDQQQRYRLNGVQIFHIVRTVNRLVNERLRTRLRETTPDFNWFGVIADSIARSSAFVIAHELSKIGSGLRLNLPEFIKLLAGSVLFPTLVTGIQETFQLRLRSYAPLRDHPYKCKTLAFTLAWATLGLWNWFVVGDIAKIWANHTANQPSGNRRRLLELNNGRPACADAVFDLYFPQTPGQDIFTVEDWGPEVHVRYNRILPGVTAIANPLYGALPILQDFSLDFYMRTYEASPVQASCSWGIGNNANGLHTYYTGRKDNVKFNSIHKLQLIKTGL